MQEDLQGLEIGKYVVGQHLGTGGMGTVYQAFSTNFAEPLAIKILRPDSADDVEQRKRFEQEAAILQALHHPHIVPIYDFGVDQGFLYFVMRRIRGLSLQSLMEKRQFSPMAAWWALHPVALALDHAHKKGVLHRDIKPGNVFIEYSDNHSSNPDAHVYLGDFGLSKIMGTNSMTKTGISLGTPHYMSPEQVTGDPLTPSTDIYSLAVVIYELVMGRLPFYAKRLEKIAFKRLEEDPPRPSALHPNFPKGLEAVILKALDREPSQRFATAQEFSVAYARAIKEMPASARDGVFWVEPPPF